MASDILRSKTIVLVGLMGAGKSSIGWRLAEALGLPFTDSDAEVEKAAGLTISEIFELHGEADFRRGEKRIIERLISEGPRVLATGGGAFVDPETRALIKNTCVSIWLRADLDLLVKRVSKRKTRPLLAEGNPRETLQKLIEARTPAYTQADIIVDSEDVPHQVMIDRVIQKLEDFYTPAGLSKDNASGRAIQEFKTGEAPNND